MVQFILPATRQLVGAASLVTAIFLSGCSASPPPPQESQAPAVVAVQPIPTPTPSQIAGPAADQKTFPTPDAAVDALLSALQSNDHADLEKIFGPATKNLISGDPVSDANDYKAFAAKTLERAQLEERSPSVCILHIGQEDWPFAIPIEKDSKGQWFFDTVSGENEILARHIGGNELETISICRDYVQAQREYASQDHNGDDVFEYAQRLHSSPGKHDGLYWDAKDDEPQSPFGPLLAQAFAEGYAPISGSRSNPVPFHGYLYHILKQQGPAAPGGAYNYVINGHMIAGFALVAWPAEYKKSGVMTFIISHRGKLYQKDLGSSTDTLAPKMTEYNPDKSWSLVK